MSSSDKELTEDERLKGGKKKQKKEDAWKPEGPKDPFALVCIFSSVSAYSVRSCTMYVCWFEFVTTRIPIKFACEFWLVLVFASWGSKRQTP